MANSWLLLPTRLSAAAAATVATVAAAAAAMVEAAAGAAAVSAVLQGSLGLWWLLLRRGEGAAVV